MGTKENPKINDLIFKELIKRGYAEEDGKKVWNIADSKLWYLTSNQSQAYLDLENTEDYKSAVNNNKSEELRTKRAKEIIDWAGKDPINVIDLGCGDGLKAAEIIKSFEGKVKVRYCPIDISSYMVQEAIKTFEKEKIADIAEFKYNISDFENLENVIPLLRIGEYKKSLLLILGNTLGNFEIHELLYKIRSAMKGDDMIMIDNAIADKDIEKKVELHSKNTLFDDFLIHIPLQLGLEKEEIEYSARFKNSRVEFFYTVKTNKMIKFQEKEVTFSEGDQIIIAIAYKYDKKDLRSFLNLYFDHVDIEYSDDESQALALCKK